MCGESICRKPMEETMWTQRMKFPLCEKALNHEGNATHLSHPRCSLRHLGMNFRGESICWKPMEETMWTQRMKFPCTFAVDLVSLLVVILVLLRVGPRVGLNNKRQLKLRKACSRNWTRRRAYWLQKRLCRANYIAFALRSKTLAAKSFKIKATHTISTLEQPSSSKIAANLDSVVVSKETRVRRGF